MLPTWTVDIALVNCQQLVLIYALCNYAVVQQAAGSVISVLNQHPFSRFNNECNTFLRDAVQESVVIDWLFLAFMSGYHWTCSVPHNIWCDGELHVTCFVSDTHYYVCHCHSHWYHQCCSLFVLICLSHLPTGSHQDSSTDTGWGHHTDICLSWHAQNSIWNWWVC